MTYLKDSDILIFGLFQVDPQVDQFVVGVGACAGHLFHGCAQPVVDLFILKDFMCVIS